jgi:hypothetical protein
MQGVSSIINTNTQYQYPNKHRLNTNIDIDDKTKGHIDIESKARDLMKKLGAGEGSLEFFCMAFHKLPDATVQRLAGLARDPGVRNPGAYFNTLVRRELAK